jgi:hypothetical protein
MYKKTPHRVSVTFLLITLGMWAAHAQASPSDGAVIIEWNQLLQQHIAGPPFVQTRLCHARGDGGCRGRHRRERDKKPRTPSWSCGALANGRAGHDVRRADHSTCESGGRRRRAGSRLATIPPSSRLLGAPSVKVAAEVVAWRRTNYGRRSLNLHSSPRPCQASGADASDQRIPEIDKVEPFGCPHLLISCRRRFRSWRHAPPTVKMSAVRFPARTPAGTLLAQLFASSSSPTSRPRFGSGATWRASVETKAMSLSELPLCADHGLDSRQPADLARSSSSIACGYEPPSRMRIDDTRRHDRRSGLGPLIPSAVPGVLQQRPARRWRGSHAGKCTGQRHRFGHRYTANGGVGAAYGACGTGR